jgi:hypothetical protein
VTSSVGFTVKMSLAPHVNNDVAHPSLGHHIAIKPG